MIDQLNAAYVNVWVLARELEQLARDEHLGEDARRIAAAALADYQYPVDSQIRSATGALRRQLAANDLMHGSEPAEETYLQFLRGEQESSPRR